MRALCTAVLVAVPCGLPAQDAEYQLRFLSHAQWTPPDKGVGLAAWAVLPNVMNEADRGRTLLLGGVLLSNRRRWVELMGGVLLRAQGSTSVMNVRYLERWPRLALFLEGEYVVDDRRVSVISNATVPAGIGGLRLRTGLEGEWIHTAQRDVGIVGPRLTIALPICGRLCRDAAVTVAYRVHSDGHRVVRQYMGVTF